MEGKVFFSGSIAPKMTSLLNQSKEQDAHNNFIFDIQRFDDAADKAGYTTKPSNDYLIRAQKASGGETRYFNNMQYAIDYISGNGATGTVPNLTNSSTAMAYIYLDGNMSGKGWQIANAAQGATKVTIDLQGHTFTFNDPITAADTTINAMELAKAIRIGEAGTTQIKDGQIVASGGTKDGGANAADRNSCSSVTIKNGTLTVSPSVTASPFERFARSYCDFTLDAVKIDGSNFTAQRSGETGAMLCHSQGTLTLTNGTSVTAQDSSHYAICGRIASGGSYLTPNTEFNIVLDTDGEIGRVNLAEWDGNLTYGDRGKIIVKKGNIESIVLTNTVAAQGAANAVSVEGSATVGSIAYTGSESSPTGGFLSYQQGSTYLVGRKGTNVDTTTNTKYYYVLSKNPTATDATLKAQGEVALTATNVTDDSIIKLDDTNKVFGVPNISTATITGGDTYKDYKKVGLDYNTKKTSVIVTADTTGTVIDATALLAASVGAIDASGATVALNIVGNDSDNTIYGGKADNTTLTGGKGNDVFVYSGKNYQIDDYSTVGSSGNGTDLVRLNGVEAVTAGSKVTSTATALVIEFDDSSKLTLNGAQGITNPSNNGVIVSNNGVSVESGKNTFVYSKDHIYQKQGDTYQGITLTSGYSGTAYNAGIDNAAYVTIDGSAYMTKAIEITGNGRSNSVIGGGKGGTISGGTGGDNTLVGSGEADTYVYSSGKSVIQEYTASGTKADKVSLSADVEFTGTKQASDKLTFTTRNSANALTFETTVSADSAKINLTDDGYLTKDGRVSKADSKADSSYTLKLFSGAKGDVSLASTVYGEDISTVDASAANQAVNLIASDKENVTFQLAANRKKDTFTLGDATGAIIKGYEAGTDKLNLGDKTVKSFTVTGGNVALTLNDNKTLTLESVAGGEVLVHDGNSKSDNSFGKTIFYSTNVLTDKKTPTSATVVGAISDTEGQNKFEATSAPTIKKLFAAEGVSNVSLVAGNAYNSTVNASVAGATVEGSSTGNGVTLVGGDKNDKLIGSSYADVYGYTKGKDVIQNHGTGDAITLVGGGGLSAITDVTKIAASSKAVKLTFGTGNVLNVKGEVGSGLKVNGKDYTFAKNAIIGTVEGGAKQASLTSAASGTVKTKTVGVDYIVGTGVNKNLTFSGSSGDETLIGGDKKTVFKGGGGNDELHGGDGKDTFFYAKGNTGETKIYDFGFFGKTGANADNLKIANGTIQSITANGNDVTFSMSNGSKKNTSIIGSFTVKDAKTDDKAVVIKANSTYYWFEDTKVGENTISQLVTTDKKITSGVSASDYNIIDLTYSTNLLKSDVAKVTTTALKKES